MKELFKNVIQEFHRSTIPLPIRRDLTVPVFPEHVRKVNMLIGTRKSGKTWFLYQMMHDLCAQGLPFEKIVYIDFADDRFLGMKTKNFQELLHAYFELYPKHKGQLDLHFFFEGIDTIPFWEKFVRRLLEEIRAHVHVTGYSKKLFATHIHTTLRGRTLPLEIFPFNFNEYLQKLVVPTPHVLNGHAKLKMLHYLREYVRFGGFPKTSGASPTAHRSLLQECRKGMLFKDIIERRKISNRGPLDQLMIYCLRASATVFSINKMYHALKLEGYNVSRNSLYDYMDFLEDTYCIFSIPKFDFSYRKSERSRKKIYAVDQGLVTAVSASQDFDLAAQLETTVFSHLRRQTQELYYYKTLDGKEVDFITIMPDNTTHLFQVSVSLEQEDTRKREVSALRIAMKELKKDTGTIITLNEEGEELVEEGTIFIEPLWKVLLMKSTPFG